MKSDLFQVLEANIKIISYFEHVDDEKIEKYENMVNSFISFDVIKTKEVLIDCLLEYEKKTYLKEEPLIIPYGIIYALSMKMPYVIKKKAAVFRYKKYKENIKEREIYENLKKINQQSDKLTEDGKICNEINEDIK